MSLGEATDGQAWAGAGQIQSGFEALKQSPEFEGPVETPDAGHTCNDHIALLYERQSEQLASVVPFVRQGLERGERVMYITGDVPQAQLVDALEAGGVDVEGALASGALSFDSPEETYLRNETFEPEEMVEFFASAIDAATDEYAGLRVAAETAWLCDDRIDLESFLVYESLVNDLFEDEDCIGLCQYDRTAIEADVLTTLVQTHPHLIYEGTLCHNVYYTPPDEVFGPDRPTRQLERMMGTIRERTEAKLALEEAQQYLQASYEITSDQTLSFAEKLDRLLELGCDRFGLGIGFYARVDPAADEFEIVRAVGDHERIRPGATGPLSETYCRTVGETSGPIVVSDAAAEGWAEDPAYETYDLATYVGTSLVVDGDLRGTLCFGSRTASRGRPSESAMTFLELLSQWVEYELERSRHERHLRDLYEIMADRTTAPAAKFDRLLEFGRERFGLSQGYLARVHDDETIEIEQAVGPADADLRSGIPAIQPEPEQFCRRTVRADQPVGATDVATLGWDDGPVYVDAGIQSYFGVAVTDGDGPYGTLAFCETDPRERPFSAAEHTYLELMGQWVSYELRQRRRERQLAALNQLGRDVTDAETCEEIAEKTITAASGALDIPTTAIVRYDGDRGKLVTTSETACATNSLPTEALCARPDGPLWESFVAGEVRTLDDPGLLDDAADSITEVVGVPLGQKGMLVVATRAPDGFAPADVEIIETTAATVEAADARADREQELHRREETLASKNESLERLNRVNDIIRRIDQALVGAASRDEVDRVVCEQLAGVGPYELAVVGEFDAVAQAVRPKHGAGVPEQVAETLAVGTDSGPSAESFVAEAVRRREPVICGDVLADATFEPWREVALAEGYHACIALPLLYGQTCYGVLVVCADQPGVFDELEGAVLTEMADTIAYAINATESKKAIVSDDVTRLTFDLEGADLAVVELPREFDYEVSLESIVPGPDGSFRAVVSTRGLVAADTCQLVDDMPPLDEVRLVAADDDSDDPFALFELTLTDKSLFSTALEHGGRPIAFSVDADAATLTIELAADAAVREFVGMFAAHYPGVELVAQRTCERPDRGPAEFFAGLTETLTERQLEALQLAYHSGYLEEPRERSATDLAAVMDISQPTFNSHLRAAQRKLCTQLFDERSPRA